VAVPTTVPLMASAATSSAVLGAFEGMPVVLTTEYLDVPPNNLRSLSVWLNGTAFTTHGPAGSLRMEANPNRAPVVKLLQESVETASWEVAFDASASIDPDADPLDFKWHVLQGNVGLRGCETPQPVFQFAQGAGKYIFRVIVTDARGASTERIVTAIYSGR